LKPITETCEPRADVRTGQLADNHFAAQLDEIVRRPKDYPVYGDPDQFFALTYPTTGLKRLLDRVFGRLSGAKVEGAEHGVVRSETSFGGGKTHGLIAVFHLARGARPANLTEFIDPAHLPDDTRIAAVVGDALDPVAGVETNGIRTQTIWGEIGAQLGPDAYEKVRRNDEERTAPGTATWRSALSNLPTIIVIDELAAHLRQLVSAGNPDVRRMAEAVPAFLKSLFELAAADPNVVIVMTLATAQDAFGKETTDLAQLMDEAEAGLRLAVEETQSVATRYGSIVKPAEDQEIGEILKRRLFEVIDPKAADEAGIVYARLYQELLDRGESFSGGADAPVTYGELVTRTYPFHPELIRVLDKRLGAIPRFQRARGSLRLLAEAVAAIWNGAQVGDQSNANPELINLADIDLSNAEIRSGLTVGLDRAQFDQVAVADFAGPSSHAATIDSTRFAGRRPYATRAARTVFLHSLEQTAQAGAGQNDWALGTLATGDDPHVIGEALGELARIAWYLDDEQAPRYRFVTEPQPAQIIAEEARNVQNTAVAARTEDLVRQIFASDAGMKAIHFPPGHAEVPDEDELRLAVMHHDHLSVTAADAAPPPSELIEMAAKAGASGAIRTNRNALCLLVADKDNRDAMRDRVRQTIAVERIVDDGARMAGFAESVRKKLQSLAQSAKLETRVAVTRCYKHLYYPAADRPSKNLRHVEIPPVSQGEVQGAQTKRVLETLQEAGKVQSTPIATNYLRDKAWPPGAEKASTKEVAEWFTRDHAARFLTDITLLRDAIADGVANGQWVLYDAQAERAWVASDPRPSIELSSERILYTPEAAEREGLTGREPRMDDVLAALGEGQLSGPELRAKLEERTNREPRKGQVAELLARATESGDAAKLAVVFGKAEPGARAAPPSEIRKGSLDAITVVPDKEAKRLSIVPPTVRAPLKPVEAEGVAGVAFQSLVDGISDAGATGVRTLSIEARADPGEGPRDVALLGKAVAQLPKHEIAAAVDVALDFDGLTPGAHIELRGAAAAYQRVEDALLALAREASDFQGNLRLDVEFKQPTSPETPEFDQIRKVMTDLGPGEIRLRAVLE